MKKAWNKLELVVGSAMPCKVQNHLCRKLAAKNPTHACILEAHESSRKRLERTLPKDHEDRVGGKGFHSVSHYNLVEKFIPMPQTMKIPDAAVGKE